MGRLATEGERVAQVLSGRVPAKGWDGVWVIWDCPCSPAGGCHMTITELPTVVHCHVCGRDYLLYDPEPE